MLRVINTSRFDSASYFPLILRKILSSVLLLLLQFLFLFFIFSLLYSEITFVIDTTSVVQKGLSLIVAELFCKK